MTRFVRGILLASLVGLCAPASALEFRTEKTTDGHSFIVVAGEFRPFEDLASFQRLVAVTGARNVGFFSPGGNPYKAMELGRIIRSLNLRTVAVRQWECVSACALAFLGGAVRIAEPGSIGVHRTSFDPSAQMSAEVAVDAVQKTNADVMSFIAEMGADPTLIHVAMSYKSDDMRYLSGEEMERFRVTTTELPQASTSPPMAPSYSSPAPQDDSLPAETSDPLVKRPDAGPAGSAYSDKVPARKVQIAPFSTQGPRFDPNKAAPGLW